MPVAIQFTEPNNHPKFVREQRQITSILVGILIRNGRSEGQAAREAEAMLAPSQPAGHAVRRGTLVRRVAG
jgi:hypothetical protein